MRSVYRRSRPIFSLLCPPVIPCNVRHALLCMLDGTACIDSRMIRELQRMGVSQERDIRTNDICLGLFLRDTAALVRWRRRRRRRTGWLLRTTRCCLVVRLCLCHAAHSSLTWLESVCVIPCATLAQAVMACAGVGVVMMRLDPLLLLHCCNLFSIRSTLRQVSTSVQCSQSLPYIRWTKWHGLTDGFVLLSLREWATSSSTCDIGRTRGGRQQHQRARPELLWD